MTWIKMEATLGNKPEVLRISRLLKISTAHVVGLLYLFWTWMDGVASTEDVTQGVVGDQLTIDRIVGFKGFGLALQKTGWVAFVGSPCSITIKNFDRHNGQTAKERALKAGRQAKWRGKSNDRVDGLVDGPVDAAPSTPSSTREEKRRLEKNLTPLAPLSAKSNRPAPANLKSGGIEKPNGYIPVPSVSDQAGLEKCCRKLGMDPLKFHSYIEMQSACIAEGVRQRAIAKGVR